MTIVPASLVAKRFLQVAAVGAVAMLTANILLSPYLGDHALYALIGDDVIDGRLLYTEILDVKQPGLFLWYGFVRYTFGATELSTRAFDVLGVVALSVIAWWMVRQRIRTSWIRNWAVPLCLASLALILRPLDLGQSELIAAVPSLGAFALVATAGLDRDRIWVRCIAAGFLVGVVAIFKLPQAPVPFCAIIVYLALTRPRRQCWQLTAYLIAGTLVAPLIIVGWLALGGGLSAALELWFVAPPRIVALPGARTTDRLIGNAVGYGGRMAPILALGLWQVRRLWRTRDPVDIALVAWLVVGTTMVLVQLWWPYHWHILTPALVVLAIRGLDDIAQTRTTRYQLAAGAALIVLAVPVLNDVFGASGVVRNLADGAGITTVSRERIAARSDARRNITNELRSVGLSEKSSLHAVANPLYHYLSGLPIILSIHGWSPEFNLPEEWHRLAQETRSEEPEYVFIDTLSARWVDERGQEYQRVLDEAYTMIRASEQGAWYRLRQ